MITSLIFIKMKFKVRTWVERLTEVMHKKIKNLMIIFIYNNRGSVCGSDLESKIHKYSSMKLNMKIYLMESIRE